MRLAIRPASRWDETVNCPCFQVGKGWAFHCADDANSSLHRNSHAADIVLRGNALQCRAARSFTLDFSVSEDTYNRGFVKVGPKHRHNGPSSGQSMGRRDTKNSRTCTHFECDEHITVIKSIVSYFNRDIAQCQRLGVAKNLGG